MGKTINASQACGKIICSRTCHGKLRWKNNHTGLCTRVFTQHHHHYTGNTGKWWNCAYSSACRCWMLYETIYVLMNSYVALLSYIVKAGERTALGTVKGISSGKRWCHCWRNFFFCWSVCITHLFFCLKMYKNMIHCTKRDDPSQICLWITTDQAKNLAETAINFFKPCSSACWENFIASPSKLSRITSEKIIRYIHFLSNSSWNIKNAFAY